MGGTEGVFDGGRLCLGTRFSESTLVLQEGDP
jgi:hypothetical protein